MNPKLTHLPIYYGDAGAREKFQEIVVHLIRSDLPTATSIRVVQGDGGIDAYIGNLTDPAGIAVYQIKYFPQEIGDPQKNQIRDSFVRIRDGKAFKTNVWQLCLPIDLGVDETKWFETWAAKQSDSGIAVMKPWGSTEIEGLLGLEKNRHLVDLYFPTRQQVNAAVYLGPNAIRANGPNAIFIAEGGINIHNTAAPQAPPSEPIASPSLPPPPPRQPSEMELKVLEIVGLREPAPATVQDVARQLLISHGRARVYLDELDQTHRLVDAYRNMDRTIPDRYRLTHEGRRLLVERGVFR